MASVIHGPQGRNPVQLNQESQWSFISAAQTIVLSEHGAVVYGVQAGVAGGTGAYCKLYDAKTGDALSDATNKIAEILMTTATSIAFGGGRGLPTIRGLTAVVNGTSAECTVVWNGKATKSPNHYPVR